MFVLEGVIQLRRIKGSDVMEIDNVPIAKALSDYNGKQIELHVGDASFKGEAEIFYFEGSQAYHRGIKYVNDFFIDEYDMMEFLERLEGESVKLTITAKS
ncbi:hypothetical protein EKG37_01740 [Robertmurraya yapensis]|uniref:Uncharacterized protein n=1 Tax=Bacillus yapensis TaxID=2492960 RepID=A0A3S0IIX0_9BACI|nr:hypothetical protein [Bacillus yapensis]RTR36304.1 hypothetical protein EKG37_01740 [Bacillus yapensis]TKT05807.1 hypothetical protein FAR12_01740 [Bacillus yapensis]